MIKKGQIETQDQEYRCQPELTFTLELSVLEETEILKQLDKDKILKSSYYQVS